MADPVHLDVLLRLAPVGPLSHDAGTKARGELVVAGRALDRVQDEQVLLLGEVLPDTTEALLERWESVYDIHPPDGRTAAGRRAVVLARRRAQPNMAPGTIESIVEAYVGQAATVVEPFAFRCDDSDSVCDDAHDVLDGGFVFLVETDENGLGLASITRAELDVLLERLKPAHTYGRFHFDYFRCDDDLSRCDWDDLGI